MKPRRLSGSATISPPAIFKVEEYDACLAQAMTEAVEKLRSDRVSAILRAHGPGVQALLKVRSASPRAAGFSRLIEKPSFGRVPGFRIR